MPTAKNVLRLIAYHQFTHISDRLVVDVPGIDRSREHIAPSARLRR
ncbi:hypothetical protein [Paenarthrobacter ureafaciens]|nr:hypothetical protein [Paenarthrobacter ureafaciens]